jgi:hypothetical protein
VFRSVFGYFVNARMPPSLMHLPSSVGKMSTALIRIPAGPLKCGSSIVVCRSMNSRLPYT